MTFFQKSSKILSMNARNLLYISKYNSKSSKKFADDKLFTKQFLESRGIGTAKLFHIIKNHRQLTDSFFEALPEEFVIKPNRGFAGAGIIVITEKKGKNWLSISGEKITREMLFRHCMDILEGKYSISGIWDSILFEERLIPHPDLSVLTKQGLSDIRVIVFNLVPVMAMLRVPTPESDGKANMELGAIGMGIDIGSGKTNGAALGKKFIKKLPNGESAIGFQVPFWDEILESVAKIQASTKIGFLGVDLIVSPTGVKVLEVNARPGLKIQIANRIPLRARLDKVSDLKIHSPEEGVNIAKTLFSKSQTQKNDFETRPTIGVKESVLLNQSPPQTLIAKIDLSATTNKIVPNFLESDEKILDITLAEKRMKLPVEIEKINDADIILAPQYLQDFYIDTTKIFEPEKQKQAMPKTLETKILRNIDEKLFEIDKSIKLLSYINPRNLAEQKELFLQNPNFSPHFFYRECELDFNYFHSEIKRLPKLEDPFYKKIYIPKIESIKARINLLEKRGQKDFGKISQKVFCSVDQNLYKSALKFIKNHKDHIQPDTSEVLDTKKATAVLKEFLEKYNLGFWKIKILEDSVADIQVTKKEKILLKKDSTFTKNRLEALLVHEIGTHIFRFENGKLQPWKILRQGTAHYLETEEGLAVWNQNQLKLDLGDKFLTPAYLVIAIYMAEKMSFLDLFHYLKTTFDMDAELAWRLCVKSKRGLEDSSQKIAFSKDAIYFSGLQKIETFRKKGGSIKDLYRGKFSVEDWEFIKDLEGLRESKFLL